MINQLLTSWGRRSGVRLLRRRQILRSAHEAPPEETERAIKDIPRALRYALPYARLLIASIALVLLGSFSTLLTPWPLKILVDNVLEGRPLSPRLQAILGPIAEDRYSLLFFAVIAGVLVVLALNGVTVLQSYVDTQLEQRMVLDFRSVLFQHAQKLSVAFFDQSRAGQIMYALNNSGASIGSVTTTVPQLTQNLITLLGIFWVTYQIHVRIALLSLVVVPILSYAVQYYARTIEPRIREVRAMEAESLTIVHDTITMLRVIVAFGREAHEYDRFRSQGERAVARRIKLTVQQTLFSLAVNGTTAIGTAVVLGYGAHQVIQGQLTVGDLLVIMSYVESIYGPLQAVSGIIANLQEQLIGLRQAFGLLDQRLDVEDAPDAIEIDRATGTIAYEEVGFSYKGRKDTLRDVSFTAQAGQVVCIVGPTGAGKSTLVSLLPRYYDPDSGRILLDSIDIRQITLRSLRQQISVVLQEPLLFAGTIADNIRYGRLDATMDEIEAAARDANAHDFISRLPNGYDTMLGERGAMLSGGERQRISVARAFLKDAPILILDEPTSSIDSKTETVILDALERLMEGRTTFMIAHRLSTVRHADQILVMSGGEIVERGTHDELLASHGVYHQLWSAQTGQVSRLAGDAHHRHSNHDGVVDDGEASLVTSPVGLSPLEPLVLEAPVPLTGQVKVQLELQALRERTGDLLAEFGARASTLEPSEQEREAEIVAELRDLMDRVEHLVRRLSSAPAVDEESLQRDHLAPSHATPHETEESRARSPRDGAAGMLREPLEQSLADIRESR